MGRNSRTGKTRRKAELKNTEEPRKRNTAHSRRAAARSNRTAMLLITFIVCIIFTVLLIEGVSLKQKILANEEKNEQLTDAIADESARTDSIKALEEYMQTDDYIKQAAKDKLGLIEDGEIVFKKAE
ncbi:MAG TPA: septum formation initiator family protein [Lachnospiraceae bacterium]|nr:septum formation initiator family protein [Lachnospiraceae bacterium]